MMTNGMWYKQAETLLWQGLAFRLDIKLLDTNVL